MQERVVTNRSWTNRHALGDRIEETLFRITESRLVTRVTNDHKSGRWMQERGAVH
jgi:hypothetical protein